MRRPRAIELAFALLALGLAGAAWSAYLWSVAGQPPWSVLLPTVALAAMAAAVPFTAGWRPWQDTDLMYRACPACGMLWSPRDAGGRICPGCLAEGHVR